jgi:hypothetical protein
MSLHRTATPFVPVGGFASEQEFFEEMARCDAWEAPYRAAAQKPVQHVPVPVSTAAMFGAHFEMEEAEVTQLIDALKEEIIAYMDTCHVRDELFVEEEIERVLQALLEKHKDDIWIYMFSPLHKYAKVILENFGVVYQMYAEDDEWNCSCMTPEMCDGECGTTEEFKRWKMQEWLDGVDHDRPVHDFNVWRAECAREAFRAQEEAEDAAAAEEDALIRAAIEHEEEALQEQAEAYLAAEKAELDYLVGLYESEEPKLPVLGMGRENDPEYWEKKRADAMAEMVDWYSGAIGDSIWQ